MGNRRMGRKRLENVLDDIIVTPSGGFDGGVNGSPFSMKDPNRYYLETYYEKLPGIAYVGNSVVDVAGIDDGNDAEFDITVAGASVGDFVIVNGAIDLQTLDIHGNVRAANTVEVTVENSTGGTINLASATYTAIVIPSGSAHGQNFMVGGTNGSIDDITHSNGAGTPCGIKLETDASDNDQVIVFPTTGSMKDYGAWTTTDWGTENEVHWECALRTGKIVGHTGSSFWAGLKLTSTDVYATDADQAYFLCDTSDDAGALTTNANIHFIYSVGGTDHISDLDISASSDTNYRLGITIGADRKAKAWVDGVQYSLTSATTAGGVTTGKGTAKSKALTNDIDLKPFVGISARAAVARHMYLFYQKISRLFFE